VISILENGDGRYAIHDADERIGWLDDRRVGFRGFSTEHDVHDAIVAAHRALDGVARSATTAWASSPSAAYGLKVVADGGAELFVHHGEIAGRLLRPQRRAFDSSFGLELVLPQAVRATRRLHAALCVAAAVAPHRHRLPGDPVESAEKEAPPPALRE
jgi:hypothetical protein